MSTVKATCPQCGDVVLSIDDVRLEVEETLRAPVTCFAFDCLLCGTHVRGEATPETAAALEEAGAAVLWFRLPLEARETHHGPLISEDDVIGFGRWLESSDDPIRHLVPA